MNPDLKVNQNTPIHIDTYAVAKIGDSHLQAIPVQVFGYWAADPITIYVKRSWTAPTDGPMPTESCWDISVTHAAGGRDHKAVPDDIDAAENFAHGLLEAVSFARHLAASGWIKLEERFRDARRRDEEQLARSFREDSPLGAAEAERIVQQAADRLWRQGTGAQAFIKIILRGENNPITYTARRTTNQIRFRSAYGGSVPRAELVEMLSKASHRSHLAD